MAGIESDLLECETGTRESMADMRRSGEAVTRSEVLTSRDNRWLKQFRVALRGGVPTSSGAVGVEGVRLVEEGLSSGYPVEAVLFSESGERYRDRLAPFIGTRETGFPVLRTTDRLFEGVADTEHPQGVAALVVPRKWTLEELLARAGQFPVFNSQSLVSEQKESEEQIRRRDAERAEKTQRRANQAPASKTLPETRSGQAEGGAPTALMVVLAGVQDPGNVGTILRTAAAFGATGVVTTATGRSGTASPYAPKALRASAGAALHLPIVSGMGLGILLTQLKMNGVRTLASCAHEADEAALTPWEVDWKQPIALLVGNEGAGLPEEVVNAADARIRIPMATQVESLNAGAAAAVVLYEAYRQRSEVRS